MDKRDGNGRFADGNAGGPGRPPRQTETAYLRVMVGAVSLEDWRAIIEKAVADAKAGNAKAREFIARYVLSDTPTLTKLAAWDEVGFDPVSGEVGSAKLAKLLAH